MMGGSIYQLLKPAANLMSACKLISVFVFGAIVGWTVNYFIFPIEGDPNSVSLPSDAKRSDICIGMKREQIHKVLGSPVYEQEIGEGLTEVHCLIIDSKNEIGGYKMIFNEDRLDSISVIYN